MRRLLMLLLFCLPFFMQAQTLAVADFSMNDHDLTAINEATKVIDDNGDLCALIKVETTQKGFFFDGGTTGIAKVDDNHPGEIWVFVPAGLRRISIMHNTLGVLRDYYFPFILQPGRTYILKLIAGSVDQVVNQKSNQQWFVLNYEPANAMVEIDGVIVEGNNGVLNQKLPHGQHKVRVSAKNYHTEVMAFTIEKEKCTRKITLTPAFGWIEVKGPAGASVFIDNSKVGEAPMKSNPLASGTYNVSVTKDKWLPYREQVLVNDNTVTTINPSLIANYVTLTLSTGLDAEIWVNDVKQGNGSVKVELTPGEYTFETKKTGHRSQSIVREITLSSTGNIDLPAPVAVLGSLSIEVNPIGAKVYLDDKYVGDAPLMLDDIIVGSHKVKTNSPGYNDASRTVDVQQGKVSDVSLTLSKRIVTNSSSSGQSTLSKCPDAIIEDGVLKEIPQYYKESLHIGDDVTFIGDRACEYSWLTSVSIPYSVNTIGTSAFKTCMNLTSARMEYGVVNIGDSAFYFCENLRSANIPGSVTTIGRKAFYGCKGLSLNIEDGVASIGDSTFYRCYGLKSVTIPGSVTTIGKSAFSNCSDLIDIYIKDGVTSIGDSAFYWCKSLTSLIIPGSVTTIGNNAFEWCEALSYLNINDGVTSIGDRAFRECSSLSSVTIPGSVKTIGNSAFIGCKAISSLSIGNGVRHIGDNAFYGLEQLWNLSIPGSVESIGEFAFSCCKKMYSLKINEGVQRIGKSAFLCCDNLTDVEISASVTTIEDLAFCACEKLTSVTISGNVDNYSSSIFRNCKNLKTLIFKEGVTAISKNIFEYYGHSITSVTLPNSLTSIGDSAFLYCGSLAEITLPEHLISIGKFAFYGCSRLSRVTISEGVTTIGQSAFYGCSITSVTIPASVTTIGNGAFYGCSITSVTIPASVTTIGNGAFWGNPITSVTISNSNTVLGSSAFNYANKELKIYVPKGSKEYYQNQIPSKYKKKIIEVE